MRKSASLDDFMGNGSSGGVGVRATRPRPAARGLCESLTQARQEQPTWVPDENVKHCRDWGVRATFA